MPRAARGKPKTATVISARDAEDLAIAMVLRTLEPSNRLNIRLRGIFKQRLLDFDKPLSPVIRRALAELFDPANYPEQKLGKRARVPSGRIAGDIARQLAGARRSGEWERAVQAAMKRYGVSRPTVTRAWKDHGEIAQRYVETGLPDFDPVPPPRHR
jgi:hypothetical protein